MLLQTGTGSGVALATSENEFATTGHLGWYMLPRQLSRIPKATHAEGTCVQTTNSAGAGALDCRCTDIEPAPRALSLRWLRWSHIGVQVGVAPIRLGVPWLPRVVEQPIPEDAPERLGSAGIEATQRSICLPDCQQQAGQLVALFMQWSLSLRSSYRSRSGHPEVVHYPGSSGRSGQKPHVTGRALQPLGRPFGVRGMKFTHDPSMRFFHGATPSRPRSEFQSYPLGSAPRYLASRMCVAREVDDGFPLHLELRVGTRIDEPA